MRLTRNALANLGGQMLEVFEADRNHHVFGGDDTAIIVDDDELACRRRVV